MAMASIMLLAGCADEAPPEVQPEPAEDDDRPELLTQVRYKNETGTTTGLTVDPAPPIIGGTQSHDITVPLGTGRVEALLSWSDPVTLELIMPEGLGSATHESGSGTAKAVVVGPATGDFTIRVRSDLAVMTDYDISIRLAPEDDSASLLAAEAVIGSHALDVVQSLRDRSLLRAPEPGRFDLYLSVRAFASEQLAAAHNDTVKIERRMEALENFARDLQTARTGRK